MSLDGASQTRDAKSGTIERAPTYHPCNPTTPHQGGKRGQAVDKKVALKFRQAFTLGGNFLNYYYHSVRAPPRDKQSYSLCGIDNTSLLIHSWLILCSNVFKIRCFALSLSCAGAACGGDNLRSFRQAFTLGGNPINRYHSARAPPRDKQPFDLCCIDNIIFLIHYCSILYSNASKMHCFTCSSVVTIYGVSAKNKCLAKFECHLFCPPLAGVTN